jgi:hypothetical protein
MSPPYFRSGGVGAHITLLQEEEGQHLYKQVGPSYSNNLSTGTPNSTPHYSSWKFFWRATVCWPLLCLCRPFCIFERCLDSNPESCRSNYQLSHPSPWEMGALFLGGNNILQRVSVISRRVQRLQRDYQKVVWCTEHCSISIPL